MTTLEDKEKYIGMMWYSGKGSIFSIYVGSQERKPLKNRKK